MTVLYGVGLGSSGARALSFIDATITFLSSTRQLSLRAVSDRYGSAPVGGVTEAPFVNAAVLVESQLSPRALLSWLKSVERRFGRVRGARYGGRSLDLDVLWSDGAPLSLPGLVVPHPELPRRAFAVVPLVEGLTRAGLPVPVELVKQARACGSLALRRLSSA